MGFVNREENPYALEVDFILDKKHLGKVIDACFRKHGNTMTAIMLDTIKELGFKFSTKGAVSISVADMEIPEEKYELIKTAEQKLKNKKRKQEEVICQIMKDTKE